MNLLDTIDEDVDLDTIDEDVDLAIITNYRYIHMDFVKVETARQVGVTIFFPISQPLINITASNYCHIRNDCVRIRYHVRIR